MYNFENDKENGDSLINFLFYLMKHALLEKNKYKQWKHIMQNAKLLKI